MNSNSKRKKEYVHIFFRFLRHTAQNKSGDRDTGLEVSSVLKNYGELFFGSVQLLSPSTGLLSATEQVSAFVGSVAGTQVTDEKVASPRNVVHLGNHIQQGYEATKL